MSDLRILIPTGGRKTQSDDRQEKPSALAESQQQAVYLSGWIGCHFLR